MISHLPAILIRFLLSVFRTFKCSKLRCLPFISTVLHPSIQLQTQFLFDGVVTGLIGEIIHLERIRLDIVQLDLGPILVSPDEFRRMGMTLLGRSNPTLKFA